MDIGAGEGNRTLVVSVGSFGSTIELHPLRAIYGVTTLPFCRSRLMAISASLASRCARSSGPARALPRGPAPLSLFARAAGELHPLHAAHFTASASRSAIRHCERGDMA